ncbi:MAG: WecB/TagA/CpsF family glycosyltransferase [Patescibacteria group bacterium]
MKLINFLNLPVVSLTPQELPGQLHQWMEQGTWLVTLNAEMMLRAHRDPAYAQLLRQADVLLPDGFGLMLWSRGLISDRFPGVELSESVLTHAQAEQKKITCLVAKNGLSSVQQVQQAILTRWPKLQLTCLEVDPAQAPYAIPPSDVVLVNFGVPRQDEWLSWLKEQSLFKLGIGVGGTFDYWTTHAKRAPLFLRRLGLESLWRLVRQPKRIVRIWNAVAVFSWVALWNKPQVASPTQDW